MIDGRCHTLTRRAQRTTHAAQADDKQFKLLFPVNETIIFEEKTLQTLHPTFL